MAGLSLIPVLLAGDPMFALMFLGLALFFNEMIVGPMDIVPRALRHSERDHELDCNDGQHHQPATDGVPDRPRRRLKLAVPCVNQGVVSSACC
jgi:hypothetical protein